MPIPTNRTRNKDGRIRKKRSDKANQEKKK